MVSGAKPGRGWLLRDEFPQGTCGRQLCGDPRTEVPSTGLCAQESPRGPRQLYFCEGNEPPGTAGCTVSFQKLFGGLAVNRP